MLLTPISNKSSEGKADWIKNKIKIIIIMGNSGMPGSSSLMMRQYCAVKTANLARLKRNTFRRSDLPYRENILKNLWYFFKNRMDENSR